MVLRFGVNFYNSLLSLGAFYLGGFMLAGRGVFDTFPPEWKGVMPFNSWASLALFGIIVFGIGNAAAAIYGFRRNNKNIFIITTMMGALFFLCTIIPTMLAGEWYLPMSMLAALSVIQLLLGFLGFFAAIIKGMKGLKYE